MHYVIGDIHNELRKLKSVLEQINLSVEDELIILGDIFDRGGADADPIGVYYELMKVQGKCSWIRGNHDQWLANYINEIFSKPEKKRKYVQPYHYNSYELMAERITEVDLLNVADLIYKLPLQKEYVIDGKHYLFAHAMATHPAVHEKDDYYLTGSYNIDDFIHNGIEGYISMVGHTSVSNYNCSSNTIWYNEKKNVVLMDCGCGFGGGRLACLCIETGKEYYSI